MRFPRFLFSEIYPIAVSFGANHILFFTIKFSEMSNIFTRRTRGFINYIDGVADVATTKFDSCQCCSGRRDGGMACLGEGLFPLPSAWKLI